MDGWTNGWHIDDIIDWGYAHACLRASACQLVLLDVSMPVSDGSI